MKVRNKNKTPNNDKLFFSRTLQYLDNYLPRQLGRSAETVRSYRDSLSRFRKYLYDEKGISIVKFAFQDCTKDLLLEYCAYLKEHGNSEATCSIRLAAIKTYVQYVSDDDISLQSIALQISRVPGMKIPKREKKLITNEGLAAILAQPKNTKIGIRDKTIMVLLYDSAVRVSELTGLRINDVDFKTLSIHIHGKGNKERSVAISEKTAAHLKRYMSIYHSGGNRPDDYLFYTVIKGKVGPISMSTVERILQKYADEARNKCPDIPEHVYPHLFRAERATHLYRDGVDSIMISKILGHSSIETTKIYALPSMDQMRAAMNKVDMPADAAEKPLWEGDEDEMARLCGLK